MTWQNAFVLLACLNLSMAIVAVANLWNNYRPRRPKRGRRV